MHKMVKYRMKFGKEGKTTVIQQHMLLTHDEIRLLKNEKKSLRLKIS